MKLTLYSLLAVLALLTACQDEEEGTPVTITRLTPDEGVSGETISLHGRGFVQGGKVITFNGRRAVIAAVVSDSVMNVVVPPDVTTGYVEVTMQQTVTRGPLFHVLKNPNPPRLSAVDVTSAEAGTVVSLTGENFAFGSDSALARNVVRIGGVRATVIAATAGRLDILMPGLPEGTHDATVKVLGETSNALPISLKAFKGVLYWPSVPGTSGDGTYYMLEARADGTTSLADRKVTEIPRYLSTGQFQWESRQIVSTYDAGSNTLLARYVDSSFEERLIRSGPPWTEFTEIFRPQDPVYAEMGLPGWSVGSMFIAPQRQAYYIFVGTPGGENIPAHYLATAALDGSGFRDFWDSGAPTYYPDGILGGNTVSFCGVSDSYLYTCEQRYDPIRQKYYTYFKRYPLDENGPIEALDYVLESETVVELKYHTDGNLYMMTRAGVEGATEAVFKLYRFSEAPGAVPEVVVDNIPTWPRNLMLLDTETGLKAYWIAVSPAGSDAVWMLNLQEGKETYPMVLYEKIQEIDGKPHTREGNHYPPYISTFLAADGGS